MNEHIERIKCWCPCGCGCSEPDFAVTAETRLCPDCEQGNHELGPRECVERGMPQARAWVTEIERVLSGEGRPTSGIVRYAKPCAGCVRGDHEPRSREHVGRMLPLAQEWVRNMELRLTVDEAVFEATDRSIWLDFDHDGMRIVEWKDGRHIPYRP